MAQEVVSSNIQSEVAAHAITIPPPINGWNTEDPISQMDPLYAVECENYFPGYGTVSLRNGYNLFASGLSGTSATDIVTGLASYGSTFMVACSTTGAAIKAYSINSSGTKADITGAATLGTSDFISVNYNGYIFIKPLDTTIDMYSWAGTGNIAAAAYTGPGGDDKQIGAMTTYKNRLYVSATAAPNIWYSGVDSVTGAMTQFLSQSLFAKGGQIIILGRISRSKNYQSDSLFVIISDQGEVLIYQGDYPASLSWSLVLHVFIPPPLSNTSHTTSGGDLIVATKIGAISILGVLNGSNAFAKDAALSNKITGGWKTAAANSSVTGARCIGCEYTNGNYIFFNIPITSSTFAQLVMNTSTGAWCKFTGQNAYCWTVFNNKLYFGGKYGKVFLADDGYFDENPADAGAALTRTTTLRPAYNYFGDNQSVKQFVEAQPIVYESNGLSLTMDADVDYENRVSTSVNTDTTLGNDYLLYKPRCGLTGIGNAASIRFDGTCTTKRRSIQAIKVYYNQGESR